MKDQYAAFPQSLRKRLEECDVREVHIGMSDTRVFHLAYANRGKFYLKIGDVSNHALLLHEVGILQWLQGKINVPEVIDYIHADGKEYMLLTEVPGTTCLDAMDSVPAGKLAALLAEGLREIHQVDITDCPYDETVATKLENAQTNLANGWVDESDFDAERIGMTGQEILGLLKEQRPVTEDLVFTHGDYCLPNVLLRHGQVSGYIDLGRAGVSDRYNDLAIASRSIIRNLGAKYQTEFFNAYGVSKLDEEKIAYYRMMDEMF